PRRPPPGLTLNFAPHPLGDPEGKEREASHGIPEPVQIALRDLGILQKDGPHAPSTVRRRLASWSTLHAWRGLKGYLGDPAIRSALKLAIRACRRPSSRKSERAVTLDILDRLIAT